MPRTFTPSVDADDGYWDGATWTSTGVLRVGSGNVAGIRIDLSSLPLTEVFAGGNGTFTLTWSLLVAGSGTHTFTLYYVDEVNPAQFNSTTRRPGTGDLVEVQLATLDIDIDAATPGDPYSWVFATDTIDSQFRHFLGLIANSNSSYCALVLTGPAGAQVRFDGQSGTAPSLVLGTNLENTGRDGYRVSRAESRMDRCPKCGSVTARETWVADGWLKGRLVCPLCYDPGDPLDDRLTIESEDRVGLKPNN